MVFSATTNAEQESDRREYPRLEVALPLKAIAPGGAVVTVWMRNLSRSGIQLRLDRTRAGLLFPGGRITPGSVLVLRFALPCAEGPWPEIEARAQVVYAQRIAADAYVIGAKYTELAPEDNEKLEKFIEDSLLPAW